MWGGGCLFYGPSGSEDRLYLIVGWWEDEYITRLLCACHRIYVSTGGRVAVEILVAQEKSILHMRILQGTCMLHVREGGTCCMESSGVWTHQVLLSEERRHCFAPINSCGMSFGGGVPTSQ